LIATDGLTVVAKPFLDPIVVENSEGNGGLADSARVNEDDWNKGPQRDRLSSRSTRCVQRRYLVAEAEILQVCYIRASDNGSPLVQTPDLI